MRIPIDRSRPFDPPSLFGGGYSVWRGPADGDGLEGEEDHDPRAQILTEIDFDTLRCVSVHQSAEEKVHGEEFVRRLRRSAGVTLDAYAFLAIHERRLQGLPFTGDWATSGRLTCLCLVGTILRAPNGERNIAIVYVDEDGRVSGNLLKLDFNFSGRTLGLVVGE